MEQRARVLSSESVRRLAYAGSRPPPRPPALVPAGVPKLSGVLGNWVAGWGRPRTGGRKGQNDESERLAELNAVLAQSRWVQSALIPDLQLEVLCKDAEDLNVVRCGGSRRALCVSRRPRR